MFGRVLIKSLGGELFTIIYRSICHCLWSGGDCIGSLDEIHSFLVLVSVNESFYFHVPTYYISNMNG